MHQWAADDGRTPSELATSLAATFGSATCRYGGYSRLSGQQTPQRRCGATGFAICAAFCGLFRLESPLIGLNRLPRNVSGAPRTRPGHAIALSVIHDYG